MSQKADALPPLGEDQDERYFAAHPGALQRLRPANSGEWPESSEVLTSPPFTLIVQIQPRVLLKLGAWRNSASIHNTFVPLAQGRISVADYLAHLEHKKE